MSAIQGAAPEAEASGMARSGEYDTLHGGTVALYQPARGEGYRTNVDALLLSSFACGSPRRRAQVAFDLGAGSGAVGLSLLHLGGAARVVLVEVDAYTAALAEANLEANGWLDRGEVLCADVGALEERAGQADLVVCNPPYVMPGHGRAPKRAALERARTGDLSIFTRAARGVSGRRARVCFVYPARELAELLDALRAAGLEPKRLRVVHAKAGAPARIVLVEAQAAKAGGLAVEPPLFEREGPDYGAELRALLAPPPRSSA
jgi:tRNA1Val (adenine37-N6)-methyltransferase